MKLFNKFFTILAFTILSAMIMTSCKNSAEVVKGDPTNTQIYTLDNGLKVYLSVDKKEPRIQTYVAVRVGSKDDPHETTGLSHYLEHLLFKGTESYGTVNYEAEKPLLDQIETEFEKYRTMTDPEERKRQYAIIDSISYAASEYFIGNEYDKIMASMGASGSNAFTSFDMTVYTEDIPSNQVEAWAKVQSDRFKNLVIRGFHTELEAVYEECNLGLSDDGGNALDTLLFAMFDKHPYGEQTTIGTQEHLKNPSIINIKNHYNNFYVPNNVAICMAGDFNPKEVLAIIKKYFGDWKRNDNIKTLQFEDEEPITQHIEKVVYGQEAPFIEIGWRFAAPYKYNRNELDNSADTLFLLNKVLFNGKAGLLDKELNRPNKVLGAYSFAYNLSDYSIFLLLVEPKDGQSLEEAKSLVMEQIERVKNGDFDQSILTSIMNNYKRDQMRRYDSYQSKAAMQYNAFIKQLPWEYIVGEEERLSKITKDDIVAFASRHLNDNYVQVSKLQGPQQGVAKLEKPAITSIRTNRDTSSVFLRDMEKLIASAKKIEPVFVDFDKELTISTIGSNQEYYYKKNEDNELFNLTFRFANGSNDDFAKLPYAFSYLYSLGTDSLTSDQFNDEFYSLACNYSLSAGDNQVTMGINGIASSMEDALKLFESLVANPSPNEELLSTLKLNWIRSMLNDKDNKSSNERAINMYAIYGPDNPFTRVLKPVEIMALTSDDLINEVKKLLSYEHSVIYYGPLSEQDSKSLIEKYHKSGELQKLPPTKVWKAMSSQTPTIYLAPYKANQINMYRISVYDNGEQVTTPENDALVRLYDSYFGSGMSSIVFQDIREAKGLAYHASANTTLPSLSGEIPYYTARVYTQNDKMIDAMKAFDEILDQMPQNDRSFGVTKDNLLQNYATLRYNGENVIWKYISLKNRGVELDYDKTFYETLQKLTLQDIVKYQNEKIKGRSFNTGLLANPAEIDIDGIDKSYGPVKKLTREEIFGY